MSAETRRISRERAKRFKKTGKKGFEEARKFERRTPKEEFTPAKPKEKPEAKPISKVEVVRKGTAAEVSAMEDRPGVTAPEEPEPLTPSPPVVQNLPYWKTGFEGEGIRYEPEPMPLDIKLGLAGLALIGIGGGILSFSGVGAGTATGAGITAGTAGGISQTAELAGAGTTTGGVAAAEAAELAAAGIAGTAKTRAVAPAAAALRAAAARSALARSIEAKAGEAMQVVASTAAGRLAKATEYIGKAYPKTPLTTAIVKKTISFLSRNMKTKAGLAIVGGYAFSTHLSLNDRSDTIMSLGIALNQAKGDDNLEEAKALMEIIEDVEGVGTILEAFVPLINYPLAAIRKASLTAIAGRSMIKQMENPEYKLTPYEQAKRKEADEYWAGIKEQNE